MSNYVKTGKKVKCIYSGRIDLIYKKVYDVFVDVSGDEFVIDESGNRYYDSMELPCWIEVSDDVAEYTDATNNANATNEQKPKFKVGDKVEVVNTADITVFTKNLKVGDIGVIVGISEGHGVFFYDVKFDGCAKQESWWFTDKCIELVEKPTDDANLENQTTKSESVVVSKFKVGDTVRVTSTKYISQYDGSIKVGDIGVITSVDNDEVLAYQFRNWWFPEADLELVTDDNSKTPIKSDGGSSSYYAQQIPKGMLECFNETGIIEAKDVIRLFLNNDFTFGNIFKAYCRVISLRNGKGKAGIDEKYDLTKASFFADEELKNYLENNQNNA